MFQVACVKDNSSNSYNPIFYPKQKINLGVEVRESTI